MRIRIVILLLTLTVILTSSAAAEVVSGIAAIVNDEIITIFELNREYSLVVKENGQKGPLAAKPARKTRQDLLAAMIDRKLILQKIRELNISVTEEEVRQSIDEIKKQNKMSQEALTSALLTQGLTFEQYKAQMKEQLERLRLMSQEVKAKVSVSENEQKAYYEANRASFSDGEAYRARAIFFRALNNATPEELRPVMVRVNTALAAAKKGADFAELAKKYSDDPNVQKDGGDLGLFRKGEMLPDIEKIVITMKPGDIDMISSAAGFYIIKLEEKRGAVVKPLESVKGQIDEILYRKKSEERFNQWTEELRKGAAIEIKELP